MRGLRSRNSLTRPRTEPDNAQNQRREYSDTEHCIIMLPSTEKQIAARKYSRSLATQVTIITVWRF